jgi:predicted DNA-binding protein
MKDRKKVKTTLYVDDELYKRSKELALELKSNATEIFNSALEHYLNYMDTPKAMKTKKGRVELIKRLRKKGYRSGFDNGVDFQRWVRS